MNIYYPIRAIRKNIGKVTRLLFCSWFCISSCLNSVAWAQSAGRDFEPPVIEHEQIEQETLGNTINFLAAVTDNNDIASVMLFYRYAGQSNYTSVLMSEVLSSSSYTISIDTQEATPDTDAVEYYIKAEDTFGNATLRGFSFQPLILNLTSAPIVAEESSIPADYSKSEDIEIQPKKKINWLYVGLGVLAVGAIAGAAGGGGSDDTNPTCGSSCNVTVTFEPPQ